MLIQSCAKPKPKAPRVDITNPGAFMQHADQLATTGNYSRSYQIYSQVLNRYPGSSYASTAAARLLDLTSKLEIDYSERVEKKLFFAKSRKKKLKVIDAYLATNPIEPYRQKAMKLRNKYDPF